jgi:hypothetical protein
MLQLPYIANVLILTPVCYALFFGSGVPGVFGPGVQESDTLRLLVACLWAGVLVCSAAGAIWPRFFWPLLVFQVVYKSLFLMTGVLAQLIRGTSANVPWGVATMFLIIVVVWPIFIVQAVRDQ